METNPLASRLKAARALAQPTTAELASRKGKQRVTGITTKELADRIDRPRFSYSRLRNLESGIGAMVDYELAIVADAVDMPLAFFTLEQPELFEQLATLAVPEIPGETGRELRADPPNRVDRSQPSTRARAGKKRAGA